MHTTIQERRETKMSLLCEKIDLDLEDTQEVYQNALETIAYLQDVVKSVDTRVLSGEKIQGFKVIEGRKTRSITQDGFKYLEKVLGREKVYKTIEKELGITELEKIIDPQEMATLITKGYVVFTPGSPKVAVIPKE
jgi:hypothetical protein